MSLRVNAELAILGNGNTISNASIVLKDNKIEYIGTAEGSPPADKELQSNTIMPGMMECHAHFVGIKRAAIEETVFTPPELAVLRASWDVNELLKSGFTTVREVGGYGIHLNRAIQEGIIPGPRIYAAGKVISTTGGHGDIHSLPLDQFNSLHNVLGVLADGKAGCYQAVRKQLRGGAEVIKYCASGGVMSEIDHPIHQQFSDEEQRAIVEEAARAEVAVAAHCHGSPGIRAAIDAGVTSIEHGSYLTDELADQMIAKGIVYVPTRYVIQHLVEFAPKMGVPQYAIDKISVMADRHFESMQLAIKKGVTIALGTDMFTSGPDSIFKAGENAKELEYLVQAGMTPADAIVVATKNGFLTLGKRAAKSGELKVGYEADILLLKSNPLHDIKILQDRANIQHVIKQGKIVV